MKYLFADEHKGVISAIAQSRVVLGFDFDGTLCPIVKDRTKAQMRGSTKQLLAQISEKFPCAVISGRSRDDVASRLEGVVVKHIVGNHGIEQDENQPEVKRQFSTVRDLVSETLKDFEDIEIEDKRFTLAIHYRNAAQKTLARANIYEQLAKLPVRVKTTAGKCVVNVLPLDAQNKGTAMLRIHEIEGTQTWFYIGDDVTDEDVFEQDTTPSSWTVRVGESRASSAQYFIRKQQEIDKLLEMLLWCRQQYR